MFWQLPFKALWWILRVVSVHWIGQIMASFCQINKVSCNRSAVGGFVARLQEPKLRWHLRKSIGVSGLWRDKLMGWKRQLAAFLQCDGGGFAFVSLKPLDASTATWETQKTAEASLHRKWPKEPRHDLFVHWYERLGLLWPTITPQKTHRDLLKERYSGKWTFTRLFSYILQQ